ncbi:MAG: nicotinate-nicotinamide nucleotide adenylyltransferase [Planctomycetota bacterium]
MDNPQRPPRPETGAEPAAEALVAERLGVFGGSFDPVHLGHLTVVRAALGAGSLDHLVLVPARISPHKLERPPTDGARRVELLELALDDLEPELRSRLSIWTVELSRPGPSFTVDTLTELIERRGPGRPRPHFVMGQDSVAGLPRWRSVERIFELVDPMVVPRGGEGPLAASIAALEGQLEASLVKRLCDGALPLVDASAASSTAVRTVLGGEANGALDLPLAVARRIEQLGLYGSGG